MRLAASLSQLLSPMNEMCWELCLGPPRGAIPSATFKTPTPPCIRTFLPIYYNIPKSGIFNARGGGRSTLGAGDYHGIGLARRPEF